MMDARSRDGRLVVVNGNWGDTTLGAILDVLETVYRALTEAMDAEPDAPIHVSRWTQDPLTVFDRRPYEILLNASSRYWSQYAYQFAHELCHVLTGYERYREHRHRWFDETVCELASLFVLHRLSDDWRSDPPRRVPGARDFASSHREYVDEVRQKHRLPVTASIPGWYAANRAALESDACRRELNGAIAETLLDDFLEEPGLWREVRLLNHWDPTKDASFADYLASWQRCAASRGEAGIAAERLRRRLGLGSS